MIKWYWEMGWEVEGTINVHVKIQQYQSQISYFGGKKIG